VLTPLFGQTYQRAKAANTKEEFLQSKEASSAAVAWGTSLTGSALQSYGVGALINATGTLSYKGAAYLGGLIFMATSAPLVSNFSSYRFYFDCVCEREYGADRNKQYITQVFSEKRPLDMVGANVAAKLAETIGLAVFLTWWGTRTNPFD